MGCEIAKNKAEHNIISIDRGRHVCARMPYILRDMLHAGVAGGGCERGRIWAGDESHPTETDEMIRPTSTMITMMMMMMMILLMLGVCVSANLRRSSSPTHEYSRGVVAFLDGRKNTMAGTMSSRKAEIDAEEKDENRPGDFLLFAVLSLSLE